MTARRQGSKISQEARFGAAGAVASQPDLSPGFTRSTSAAPNRGVDYNRCSLIACALMLLGGILLVEWHAPMKDDVAWLIYVAQAWMSGGQPYVTEIDINPPPIIWFSAFAAWLAHRLGASVETVYPAITSLVAVAAAWWVASLLVRRGVRSSAALVFLVTLAVLLIVPAAEFGQREHLIACLALPSLGLRVAKWGEGRFGAAEGFAAGLLVGICCAIKPLYVVPFFLVEVAMWRRGGRICWPVLCGAFCAGASIVVLSVLVHPAYFADIVPLALSLYRTPFKLTVMFPPGALLLIAALIAAWVLWWLHRRELRSRDLVLALLLFASGAMFIYLWTGRGWFYQRIPATVATVLALCVLLLELPRGLVARGAAVAMLLVMVGQAGARFVPRVAVASGLAPALAQSISDVVRARGATRMMAFSSTLGLGFPVVQMSGAQWSSRFASMWAVRGELEAEQAPGQAVRSTRARRWVVDDFLAACPDIVVLDHADGVDYPEALSRFDPAFARAWASYQLIDGPAGVEIFHRPSDAPPCPNRSPRDP